MAVLAALSFGLAFRPGGSSNVIQVNQAELGSAHRKSQIVDVKISLSSRFLLEWAVYATIASTLKKNLPSRLNLWLDCVNSQFNALV